MITMLIVGGIAGWLAGNIMSNGGYGIFKNILLGIIGGIVGGWIFRKLHLTILDGLLGEILQAMVGAIIILFIADFVRKK
jgi:uncharacterized membrane protein YeaQ/YmgE (transglycosylase-associated protein family)